MGFIHASMQDLLAQEFKVLANVLLGNQMETGIWLILGSNFKNLPIKVSLRVFASLLKAGHSCRIECVFFSLLEFFSKKVALEYLCLAPPTPSPNQHT